MELIEAIKTRKSIRGYKATPVPKEILTEILEVATRAPSGMNSQPWEFIVLGGKKLDDLTKALEEQFQAGIALEPDFPMDPFTGIYRKRQIEVGVAVYQLMGIAREDTEKRNQWTLSMLRAFDAPNAIIIAMDEEISSSLGMFNLGLVTQNIVLTAVNYGLGTCILGELVSYPKLARQIANIPQSKKLAIGIAIGYPDWDFPANKLQTNRELLTNITTWHGF